MANCGLKTFQGEIREVAHFQFFTKPANSTLYQPRRRALEAQIKDMTEGRSACEPAQNKKINFFKYDQIFIELVKIDDFCAFALKIGYKLILVYFRIHRFMYGY